MTAQTTNYIAHQHHLDKRRYRATYQTPHKATETEHATLYKANTQAQTYPLAEETHIEIRTGRWVPETYEDDMYGLIQNATWMDDDPESTLGWWYPDSAQLRAWTWEEA
jgi:hypothetical protein